VGRGRAHPPAPVYACRMRLLPLAALLLMFAVTAPPPAATGDDARCTRAAIPDPGDEDCDGVRTDGQGATDNCPTVRNADQANTDADYTATDPPAADGSTAPMTTGDTAGDACDDDDDADGVPDSGGGQRLDNCRTVRNPGQLDADGNGYGEDADGNDLCATDRDGDGVVDERDNCPGTPNPGQEDFDADGRGDVCDSDDDADGIPDVRDNCPYVSNSEQTDSDGDGVGNACDPIAPPPPGAEPTPAPPPPGAGGSAVDATAPRLLLRVARRQRAHDLRGGMATSVGCSEACGLTARLTVSRRDARRMRLGGRRLGESEALLGAAGRTWLFFEWRRGTLARLDRSDRRGARAVLRVAATDPAGNVARAARRLRLRG